MNINGAQLHLLINHFPVVGFPIVAAAFLYAVLRKRGEVEIFAYLLTIAIWITGLISYLTGEGAESVVKSLPEFSEDLVHSHEDVALISLIITGISALVAITRLPLVRRRLMAIQSAQYVRIARWIFAITVVGGCVVFSYAAHQGGLIRHTEIRK